MWQPLSANPVCKYEHTIASAEDRHETHRLTGRKSKAAEYWQPVEQGEATQQEMSQ